MPDQQGQASPPVWFEDDAPDAEWFKLTEGMDAYERFRYIARHVLSAALDEARSYVDDGRIFEDLEDDRSLEEHLATIDQALRDDASLSPMEKRFLCAAVAEAMADQDMEAVCPWQDLAKLASASNGDRQVGSTD